MGLLYVCPVGAAPGDIIVNTCPFDIGQIQKVIFQRKYSDNVSTRNSMTVANAAILATWSALLSAIDHTKAQITPFISNPVTTPGEVLSEGGNSNETVNGIAEVNGVGPTLFTALLKQITPASKASIKAWFGENMGVYLVTQHSKIIGQTDDVTTPATLHPIPIESFFLADRNIGGFVARDSNQLQWNFNPGWDDTLLEISPTDFDPLTALAGS